MTQSGANEDGAATGAEPELEIYSDEYDKIIRDTSRPVEERSRAAVEKAGAAYAEALLDEQDRGHPATGGLIRRAMAIADAGERERVIGEIRELRKRYAGTQAEYKAPNGKPSNLIAELGEERGKEAWYAVRTAEFKKWFGDWERAARIAEIEKTVPQKITIGKPISQKEAEAIARSFTPIKNRFDGRIAEIPINTIGKIFGHKGFDITQIIESIPALYEMSRLGWSEPEMLREGHKAHPNIKAYHHYINKFADDTGEYFIRFTINEEKVKQGKTGKNTIHSAAISDIAIYKNGDGSQRIRVIGPGEANTSPFYDLKLADFLNSVKDVSQVTDENGEPLAAFHATAFSGEFDVFQSGNSANTFYFAVSEAKAKAAGRGDRVIPVFLSLKNPVNTMNTPYNWYDAEDSMAVAKWRRQGHDGVYAKDEADVSIAVFSPEQIKSATGNAGTYAQDNPSILYQTAYHGSPYRFKRFDHSHMGEGEGAQSYGWGHYFASRREIAEWYYEELSNTTLELSFLGETAAERILALAEEIGLDEHIKEWKKETVEVDDDYIVGMNDVTAYISETGETTDIDGLFITLTRWVGSEEAAIKLLKKHELEYKPGQLYEVDISGGEEMLDWDQPLSEQPEVVKPAIEHLKSLLAEQYPPEDFKKVWRLVEAGGGKNIYQNLSKILGSDKAASQYLSSLGIKGIRYLDGNSRADGEGSHNYVIFDDRDIDIIQTYYQDEGLAEFLNSYPAVTRLASAFASGEELAEYFGVFGDMPEAEYRRAKDAGYFDRIHRQAKEGAAEPVRHEGEYVLTEDGLLNFGEITPEQAKEIRRQAGPIRLRAGEQDAATDKGYGEAHIERPERMKQIRKIGFTTARDFVDFVGNNYDAIYDAGGGGLYLYAHGEPNTLLVVKLEPSADSDFYDVKTGYFTRKNFFKNKKPLWEQTQGGLQTESERAQSNRSREASPKREFSGNSDNPTIAEVSPEVKPPNRAAEREFYGTLHEGAREIHGGEDLGALEAELAAEGRDAKAFVDFVYTDAGFQKLIETAAVWREQPEPEPDAAETARNEMIYRRVQTTFNERNGNWRAAFAAVKGGHKVSGHTKGIIRGMIRNRPLQYMEAWAMMTGDDTWLPGETDAKRIARLDTQGVVDDEFLERQSPEELERIGRRLGAGRVAEKIANKTLRFDDTDLEAYDAETREKLAALEKKIAGHTERLSDYEWMLAKADENAKKERIVLEQKARDTSDTGLKAAKQQQQKLLDAQKRVLDTIAEMDAFASSLKVSEKKNFLEFRKMLREREELRTRREAVSQARTILKRDFRSILRRADLKTTHLAEVKMLEWIQSHFDRYSVVAKFLGPKARSVQELYNAFATDGEYRRKLKNRLEPLAYHAVERAVFKDLANLQVRPYVELTSIQRRTLYKHLIDNQGIFEELGIDVEEGPPALSDAAYAEIEREMREYLPPELMSKLKGMRREPEPREDGTIRRDKRGEPVYQRAKTRLEDLTLDDIQTLAGAADRIRKRGREEEAARKDARRELFLDFNRKFERTLREHRPKSAGAGETPATAEGRLQEGKRSGWRSVWFDLMNTRRFLRMLEGGEDGWLYYAVTSREYEAYAEENRQVERRRAAVLAELKAAGVSPADLGKITFELWDGKRAVLDEMLSIYYAQYNERALNAVVFGNYADAEERRRIKELMDAGDTAGYLELENVIARRYWDDIKKFDQFLQKDENEKYRRVMEIIGADFEENYERLSDFMAREYNEQLGREKNYMPLYRLGVVPVDATEVDTALAAAGLSGYIGKGMTKGRVDIPSFAQQPVKLGMYALWDGAVVKQEHLMAYDGLHRTLKTAFEGPDSAVLRELLRAGHSDAAVKRMKEFISELAAPPVYEDLAALDKMSRLIRGSYAAAVLGWRVSSVVKQLVESPAPFFQYVNPKEYAAAAAACVNEETRNFIFERSIYMKTRYRDPSIAVVKEMERMALAGKLGKVEGALTKFNNMGMKGLAWADAVSVVPGWMAAYRKRMGELSRAIEQAKEQSGKLSEADQLFVNNAEWVFTAKPVSALTGSEFQKTEVDLITQVERYFEQIGNKVELDGLGTVELTRRGAKSSIGHGMGRLKAIAFYAVPEVIKKGKVIEHQTNWKGRGYDTYVIDAPVSIGNENGITQEYIVEVIIEQNKNNKNEYYLHEVELKEKAQSVFKTATERGTLQALGGDVFKTATERGTAQPSRLIIGQKLEKIKQSRFAGMTPAQAEAEAIRYADMVVRDCQPSSVLMDQIPLLKKLNAHPLGRIFGLFQTPMAVIFQNLFMDAPANFRRGRVLNGLWSFAIYGFTAALIGAMKEDDDGEELNPKNRGIDALGGIIDSVPVVGSELSFVAESLLREGKIKYRPSNSLSPVWDSGKRAAGALAAGKWARALDMAVDGFGYYAGLPVGLKHEVQKAVEQREIQPLLGIK